MSQPVETESAAAALEQFSSRVHSAQAVRAAVDALAARLERRLSGSEPVMLCILKGGVWLTMELARRLSAPQEIEFVHAARYHGALRAGELELLALPRRSLSGRDVLIVDDIFDAGVTLQTIRGWVAAQDVRRALGVVLARKRSNRSAGVSPPDDWALEVPDRYVFGCGMDYLERWRGLDEIRALRSD